MAGTKSVKLLNGARAVGRFVALALAAGFAVALADMALLSLWDAGVWANARAGLVYGVAGPWQLIVNKLFAYGWLVTAASAGVTALSAPLFGASRKVRANAAAWSVAGGAGLVLSAVVVLSAVHAGVIKVPRGPTRPVLTTGATIVLGAVMAAVIYGVLTRRPLKRVAVSRPLGAVAATMFAAAGALSFLLPLETARPLPRGPNVVIISIDALRADAVGRRADGTTLTPELDRFAAGATTFRRCAAAAPWTLPALASLHTGLYPPVHAAGGGNYTPLMPDYDTLAEILYRHGYDTAGIPGSMCAEPRFGLAQGFTYYRDVSTGDFLVASRLYYTPLPDLFKRGSVVTEGTTPPLTRKTLHYLRGRRGHPRPFFLWVHFLDPHAHYDPPPAYVAPDIYRRWRRIEAGELSGDDWAGRVTRRALYDGEVRYVDAAVGRVLDTVKEAGMDASTVVVVTADHGESFWEHGENGHGSSVNAEVTDIPLLIRAPGVLPAGKVVDTQVSQVDIFATVLDLAGVPAAKPTQSRSLVPLARGEAPAFDGWAFTSNPYGGDTSVIRGTDGPRAVVFSGAKGSWSFYDLRRDKWMRWPQRDVPWGEPYVRAINGWRAGNDELRRRYHVRYRKDKMVEAVMRALGYIH